MSSPMMAKLLSPSDRCGDAAARSLCPVADRIEMALNICAGNDARFVESMDPEFETAASTILPR